MGSLKGPDFQGCLSPAECGAEGWGTMKRAAAERLFQSFDYCRGGCFLPASPCAHLVVAGFPSAFALQQLLGAEPSLGCSLPLLCFQEAQICSSALGTGSATSSASHRLAEVNCNHT